MIRRAEPGDAQAVARVLGEAFREYEPRYTPAAYAATTPIAETVRQRLAEGPTWVAIRQNEIVGTVSAVTRKDGLYVRSMATAPAARGRGLGRNLLVAVEAFAAEHRARRLYLSTTPFLADAIRFYEAAGFRRTHEPPRDLHGTPLFTMEKKLRL